jgi:hypothetical protein
MNTRADIRADFIKRLFAVAISVGFATTLTKMNWVETGSLPGRREWEQLAILATGLIATVASWDGYLASIQAKPLNGYGRFVIDILLVFIYMFFLISSQRASFWLPILALVFVLYFIWDVLTVREYFSQYDASLVPPGSDTYRVKFSDVVRVYVRGLLNKPATKRGPIITLSWAIFFAALAVLNYLATARYQVFVACGFAIAGLILYRLDKNAKTPTANVRGYGMVYRVILICGLLGFAALYFCRFGVAVSA